MYDNTPQSQAVPTDPPGPTNPLDFEVLQNLCKVNSLSVFRHSDPQPTVQVPLPEVPQDDLGFAAMDALLTSGIPFTREPLPEVAWVFLIWMHSGPVE